MKKYLEDKEYLSIVEDILNNEEFKELKNYKHHGDNRYDHCIRVSYESYRIAKKYKNKNYKSIARAGLLHDFFLINNQKIGLFKRIIVLYIHPRIAVENAKKYFKLSKLEENIILTHMFPVGIRIPICLSSLIVNIVDKYVSTYERIMVTLKKDI